jgi:2-hydroxychromene-2-carboxylate isomerase
MIIRFYFSFRCPFAGVAFHRMSLLPEPIRLIVETMPLWPDVIFGGHMDNRPITYLN